MIKDARKNLEITYNLLNLPKSVKSGDIIKARYVYTADGNKLQVRDGDGTNGYDYVGSFVYKKNNLGTKLELINFSNGVIVKVGDSYDVNYFMRDHLGSVRAIVDETGTLKEQNDYYAFGARQKRADYLVSDNRYRYNGKEVQTTGDLGYLDYGARMYDAGVGRWFVNDPLAEKYYSSSQYAYTLNSPINAIDPDGKIVIFINGLTFSKLQQARSSYWGEFDKAVMKQLNDNNVIYRHGGNNLSPLDRYSVGYKQAQMDAKGILQSISDEDGYIKESIKIVTHSMGGAYSKGYAKALKKYFKENGYKNALITLVADFDPFQAESLEADSDIFTQQFIHKKRGEGNWSRLANQRQKSLSDDNYFEDPNQGNHDITSFFNDISKLKEGTYVWSDKGWVLKGM